MIGFQIKLNNVNFLVIKLFYPALVLFELAN